MNQEILTPSRGIDHPTVKNVIKLANQILNEGRILNIDYLYRRAKRELQIPREGLSSIIQYLINKKIIINGSKFTRATVLDNDIRNFTYNFIQENIGLHFSAIKKSLVKTIEVTQVGVGQLIWHLEMLLRFNLIKSFSVGNHTIFIPIEYDEDLAKICYLARNLVRNKILRFLIEQDRISRSLLPEAIQESRENVYYHIKVLIEHNCIIDDSRVLSLNSKFTHHIIKAIQYLSRNQKLNYHVK